MHWPEKNRRGDSVDVAPFLLQLMGELEKVEAPDIKVWTTLVDKLSRSARSDDSLWPHVRRAMQIVFEIYQPSVPSKKLLRIGLESSISAGDARLASDIVQKEVAKCQRFSQREAGNDPSLLYESNAQVWGKTEDSYEENLLQAPGPAPIPLPVFRKALETSLRSKDAESATSIVESFAEIESAYPLAAQGDIYGLALLCYVIAGEADKAQDILFSMIERNMHPR